MRFILFVEGHTENRVLPQFFKRWLDPKLSSPVGIKCIRFEGWAELLKDAPLKAEMHLNGPKKNEIIAVISLLDLYGPTIYPHRLRDADERYDWAKKYIEDKVDQPTEIASICQPQFQVAEHLGWEKQTAPTMNDWASVSVLTRN